MNLQKGALQVGEFHLFSPKTTSLAKGARFVIPSPTLESGEEQMNSQV